MLINNGNVGGLKFSSEIKFSFTDIVKNFLMFQDKMPAPEPGSFSLDSSESLLPDALHTNLDYKKTAFMIELMLIDGEEEKK